MRVAHMRVQNFRAIGSASLDLDRLTYLVGRNGAGKSTFLNALAVFFNPQNLITLGDFHQQHTDQPIEVTLTFSNLPARAADEFARYIRGERLVVTRRFHQAEGRVTDDGYYGVRAQFPAFSAVRERQGRERIEAYRAIQAGHGLPNVRSVVDVDRELALWEDGHPAELELIEDDGRFFGYRNVAAGKLDKYLDFVLVPAVRDVAADSTDSRDSALRRLVDAVIRRAVNIAAPLEDLRAQVGQGYDELLRRPELSLQPLQDRITASLQQFAPGARVELGWDPGPDVRLPDPSARARLEDDGVLGDVQLKGHGLQRSYLMAALHALSEIERSGTGTDHPDLGLLLAIEEPELFQHPAQSRIIAATLQDLTASASRNVSVLACTHSPIFVDVRSFESIRVVRKRRDAGGAVVSVQGARLSDVAARLSAAHGGNREFTADGLRPGLVALMNPYVNEALFADYVILVEGEEDKALIEAYLPGINEWSEVSAQPIAIVPVGGKHNLDKMAALLSLLGIPTFLVWDLDTTEQTGDEAHWNQTLERLAADGDATHPADTHVQSAHTAMCPDLTRVFRDEIGAANVDAIRDAVCRELGIEVRSSVTKNSEVLRLMLARAATEGRTAPTLRRLAQSIVAFVRT